MNTIYLTFLMDALILTVTEAYAAVGNGRYVPFDNVTWLLS